MLRYLKIYWKLIKFAAIQETTYRFGFFLEWFVELAYFAVSLLGIKVLFWNIKEIAGWNFNQMLVLSGLHMVFAEVVLGLVFIFNLRTLPAKIVQGELDLILTKPLNSQFVVSLWRPYFAFVPSLLSGILVIYLGFESGGFTFNPFFLVPFLIIFISGLVIAYSVGMIVSTFSVWFVNARALPELAEKLFLMSERPHNVFTGIWRIVFLLILPLAFMVSFPAKTLMGIFEWWWILTAPLLAVIFLKTSNVFWRFALRHYQSASS